jgi:hypothetical protein
MQSLKLAFQLKHQINSMSITHHTRKPWYHYIRNLQRRRVVTKKGDMRWAHLRHHVSHYNVIGDAREGTSQICLLKNKKICSRRCHCRTDGNGTKLTRHQPLDPSPPAASRPIVAVPALPADNGSMCKRSTHLLRRTTAASMKKSLRLKLGSD